MSDKAENFLHTVGAFAKEVLTLAEEKGLTLAEVLEVPRTMEQIIKNELRNQKVPYKREKAPDISPEP